MTQEITVPKPILTGMLPVMESFYTIQGEGSFTGHAAYFIRLAGCDVGCVWCDVKESWDREKHPEYNIEDIVNTAAAEKGRLAVITGGEPCMHDLTALVEGLKLRNFSVNLETSGAWPITGAFDFVCVSPKKFKAPLRESLAVADELKVVIFNASDFEWATENARWCKPECRLFLQPEFEKSEKMLPLIVEFVKNNPQWNISLQTHKFIGIP